MPIRVDCGSCQATFRVKDEHAGKNGKCPRCKAAVVVPRAEPAATAAPAPRAVAPVEVVDDIYSLADAPRKARAAPVRKPGKSPLAGVGPTRPTRTPLEILTAFRGEIQAVRPTLVYRLWIAIVAGVMVLLPLVYLGIVALVAYGVYYHAVNHIGLMKAVRNARLAVSLYLAPLIVGGAVVAFMLKPLFARPARRAKVKVLDPDKDPLVFAFVDGVCKSVGAPRPSRIEVDCMVNASARFDGGRLAWLTGDLVLTIGLPLAAGLSLRSFAGVLAHEFGHFSQRVGMRLGFLIWSINSWFARVVYERDSWDETLEAWSHQDNGGGFIIVGWLARLAVWLTRRVLWVLMMVGRVVSSFLSRQMEFDADRYVARMVGSEVFAETTRRILDLGLGDRGATYDLVQSWQERRLPDHMPNLVLANIAQVPPETRKQVHQERAQARTGLFDTHPADKDRIARARLETGEPVFRLDGPATDLFRDFDSLARTVSLAHYRLIFGPQVSEDHFYPVAEALEGQEVAKEGFETLDRFFRGGLDPVQPLPLSSSYPGAPTDLNAARKALVSARKAMRDHQAESVRVRSQWIENHVAQVSAETALVLLKAGVKIKGADYGLDEATAEAANSALREADETRIANAEVSAPFESAASRRITLSLAMLESDAVVTRVPDGPARRDEARALYPCAALLAGRIIGELPAVIAAKQVLANLLEKLSQGTPKGGDPLVNACLRAGSQLHQVLQEFQWKLGTAVDYPFEHSQEGIGLGRFILPLVPDEKALGDLYRAADEAIDKVTGLHHRVLGRLAVTAEEVERVVGLKPLEAFVPAGADPTPAGSEEPR